MSLAFRYRKPNGWITCRVPDIAEINPSNPAAVPADDTLVSFVPMAAITPFSGQIDLSEQRVWAEVKKGFTRFQNGDVIFAKITPCMENGKSAILRNLHGGAGAGSTEFHVLRPSNAVLAELLRYFMLQGGVRKAARDKMAGTAGQLRVPATFLMDCTIPLPPLPEQHRIVAAIESYFSRLDEAVALLERVQRNLKRCRASVLKAAVEGRLVPTEAELARAEGRSYEPASVLLRQILEERKRRWVESGKPGRHEEPVPPKASELPNLPEGWCWATVGQLGKVSGGLTKNTKRDNYPLKLPYLRVANVYADELRLNEVEHLGVEESEVGRTVLEAGDLLVVEGNGSVDQIGRVACGTLALLPVFTKITSSRFDLVLSAWVPGS